MRKHFPLRYDLEDDAMLKQIEQEFAELSHSRGVVRNCVGCLDGLAIRIKCPSKVESVKAAAHLNRKKFYSLNCQAICDAQKRFRCGHSSVVLQTFTVLRWVSVECAGATHDQLAFMSSSLGQKIDDGKMPEPYAIFADAAYVASESVVTPFSGELC
jgi:hypothetical protein